MLKWYTFNITHMNDTNTTITTQDYEEQDTLHLKVRRLKTAKYLLSFLLALSGLAILTSQLGPLATSYIKGKIMENNLETIKDPTSASDLNPQDSDLPYYDPGLSYFQNLIQHISPDYVLGETNYPSQTIDNKNVKIDDSYSKNMKLSISKLNIKDVNVTPNVDSFNEKVYDAALKKGLAHFKGTPLPGDGGNSFIYGHSAVESWFSSHPDYAETIFSKLEKVEISDTIKIKKDGKTLIYTVQKKKITEPNDFDVISGMTGKETVTLMTCWPLGIGSQRLIVIAELTDGQ